MESPPKMDASPAGSLSEPFSAFTSAKRRKSLRVVNSSIIKDMNQAQPEPKPEKPLVFQMDYTEMTVEEQNRNCIHYNTKVTPMSKKISLKSLLSGTVFKDVTH